MSMHMTPIMMTMPMRQEHEAVTAPFFLEYRGNIWNLSACSRFYVDHFPFFGLYYPCGTIRGCGHRLHDGFESEEQAMEWLRSLISEIDAFYRYEH